MSAPYAGGPVELDPLEVDCAQGGDAFLRSAWNSTTSDFVGKVTRVQWDRNAADPADVDDDGTGDAGGCGSETTASARFVLARCTLQVEHRRLSDDAACWRLLLDSL
jgi:hypothetical protein